MKEISVKVGLNKYSLETIRYSAYSLTDEAYVFLRFAGRGAVEVKITPKSNANLNTLRKRFLRELEDEKLRERLFRENAALREFLVIKALTDDGKVPKTEDGLTPEQEKELDELIKQVEEEIERENKKEGGKQVTMTWEERYGARSEGKK